jgi:threonine synthase
MARPTKLTPAVEKVILDALSAGATRTAAFVAAGVARSKISVYMRRFGTFRDAVLAAEASAEVRATITVRQAINGGDWRAAAWWLERRRNDEWGRRDKLDIIATVRDLAREHGLSPEEESAAVAEALRITSEHRGRHVE